MSSRARNPVPVKRVLGGLAVALVLVMAVSVTVTWWRATTDRVTDLTEAWQDHARLWRAIRLPPGAWITKAWKREPARPERLVTITVEFRAEGRQSPEALLGRIASMSHFRASARLSRYRYEESDPSSIRSIRYDAGTRLFRATLGY